MSLLPLRKEVVLTPEQQLQKDYKKIENIQSRYGEGFLNPEPRGNFFSVDPFGYFGHRQQAIKNIATDARYDAASGKFDLGDAGAKFNVTQQDVANYYMTQFNEARKGTAAYEYGMKNFPKAEQPNATTSQRALEKVVQERQDVAELEKQLRGTEFGTEKLNALKAKLKAQGRNAVTSAELETLKTKADLGTTASQQQQELNKKTLAMLDKEAEVATQEIAASKARMRQGDRSLDLDRDRLGLETRKMGIDLTLAQERLGLERFSADTQRAIAENQQINAQADRALQRELALLTREDNLDDRAYNRERDQRDMRMAMIMQIMKGLDFGGKIISI